MTNLSGQRVLLIAPRYFGYEREIRAEIERHGALVDWLPDRPFDTPLLTAATKYRREWILPGADWLYRRMLDGFGATHYDVIFVVNGQTLSAPMREELRTRFPGARTVLYMWDSLRNRPNLREDLHWFDAAFTFDPEDARTYGMRLRALFYGPQFNGAVGSTDFEHHLSFVGTAHTDRWAVVDRIRARLPSNCKAYWYLYLQAPWVYQAYRITKPAMRRAPKADFKFVPLSKETLGRVFRESNAIVDIEHPQQRGLTMRTLETFGARKKLITTNSQVRDYDFYRPENVCVIDRDNPIVPEAFLVSPFVSPDASLFSRYSLAGWVDEVLTTSIAGSLDSKATLSESPA